MRTMLPYRPRSYFYKLLRRRLRCVTDIAGRCEFSSLSAATYQLRVEKQGFYSVMLPTIQTGAAANIDVTLPHQQEVMWVDYGRTGGATW